MNKIVRRLVFGLFPLFGLLPVTFIATSCNAPSTRVPHPKPVSKINEDNEDKSKKVGNNAVQFSGVAEHRRRLREALGKPNSFSGEQTGKRYTKYSLNDILKKRGTSV